MFTVWSLKGSLGWLDRDGRLLVATKTVRSFGYGLLSVVLGLYLEESGYPPALVGTLLSGTLVGSALLTAVMTSFADQMGRKRILLFTTTLMIASGLAFALSDNIWLLMLAALSGTISSTSGEVGPFETVEQAALPQTTRAEHRNRAFGWYHTLGAAAVAAGSLAAGLPSAIQQWAGVEILLGYRLMFTFYAALGALSFLCLVSLSEGVEVGVQHRQAQKGFAGLHRSRGAVARLSALFALDALGGGFVVQSLLAYWFALKFQVGGELLGPVFLGVNLMKAISYPLAVKLAARFGLINTMVFTHLPSNLLLILIPFMPDLRSAVVCLLARHLLAQMDVPARSSYVVAIVEPDERTAATGVTTLVRTVAQAAGPAFGGVALQLAALGSPFFLGGGLKIIYDLALYFTFRGIRPPEEAARRMQGGVTGK